MHSNRTAEKILALVLSLLIVFGSFSVAFASGAGNDAGSAPVSSEEPAEQGSTDDAANAQNLNERRELYTMMGLIAVAAIFVGLRDKRNRRR